MDRLSDVESLNLVLNVLVGGVDTTQSQLAHALRVSADAESGDAARKAAPKRSIEEVLRFEPIGRSPRGIAMEGVPRGVEFPEGRVVLVSAFTGNREGTAAGFDITADRTGRAAHVRRGRALLPGREPRARGDAGGARVPRPPDARARARRRAGVRIDGIYGLDSLPIRWGCAKKSCRGFSAGETNSPPTVPRVR